MNEQEVHFFWVWYRKYERRHQRKGQAMMNAFYAVSPELYDMVSGTKYDVFYTDTSQDIYRFREFVGV